MSVTLPIRFALAGVSLILAGCAGAPAVPRALGARDHLRLASPAEVRLGKDGARTLTGHARAFVQCPDAKELLPEVIALALEEAEKDQRVCYRVLVFELTSAAEPRPPSTLSWVDTRDGTPVPKPVIPIQESEDALRAMLAGLRSRDASLRAWVLAHLPLDARIVEAFSQNITTIGSEPPEMPREEAEAASRWLDEFACANQELVQQEHRSILQPWSVWTSCSSA